jgi:epoxyqueuosine reductase QueG
MDDSSLTFPLWLSSLVKVHKIPLWGAADVRGFSAPVDKKGQAFPFAFSWAVPINPQIMVSIQHGINRAYADEYAKVNNRINACSKEFETEIKDRGFRALALPASKRSDKINIKGDFPHKTAATRAGLGWIGRHCQLITRKYGPWVRLGTVFTDMKIPCGPVIERSFCGNCIRCIDACPAGALKGSTWYPGLSREQMLDVYACDLWKKKQHFEFHKGHNCGICSAVCPFGTKVLKTIVTE